MQPAQDWNPVVIRKKAPAAGTTIKDPDAARRAGLQVDAIRKNLAGNSSSASGPVKNAAKLDAETEELHHERVSTELKQNIMKARLEKKWTQAQLAQAINELPKIVQEYEQGKAIPNQAIISKMERALGCKLRPSKK